MSVSEKFLTPVGRLVQGDLFTPQTTDQQGNPRVIKTGPNAGQPNPQYFIAVAFAKNDPGWPALFAVFDRVARGSFPTLFPNNGGCSHPQFAWKIIDGDGVDTSGKPNSAKEGFAGHWVIRFTSGFAPKCFHAGHYNAAEQITDPKAIRRGYYVRVSGTVVGNDQMQKPGLYVNLELVELSGYGEEIVSGPDAAETFGGSAPQLPAGATATPMAAPMAAPGMAAPGMAPPMAAPMAAPVAPVPQAAPVAPVPQAAVVPNTAYMAPPPAAGMVPPPAAPARQMTAAANGMTYEQAIGLGWTDELLRQHGMMV